MDLAVFLAVLVGAACHAAWNALIKTRFDPLLMVAMIAIGSGVCSLPLIAIFGFPNEAAWPWLGASMVIHAVYLLSLTAAYSAGDVSQVYPLARGTAPLLTAFASMALLGESMHAAAWGGVVLLGMGVILMSLRGGSDLARFEPRAVQFALLTAVMICGYSVVDGTGARTAENPHVYTAWMFLLTGLAMGPIALAKRGRRMVGFIRSHWRLGLAGGGLSLLSYWIAIWAMTLAPIAMVAALRETSVLFASAIAVLFLGERLQAWRALAACVIVAGLLVMRLA